MRLPNGFGQCFKLKGNRRRPWIVRKTIGWTEDSKQLFYIVGYYETRQKGLAALTEYNKNPTGKRGELTLKELYVEWSDSKFEKISIKTVQTYETAWNHLSAVGHMEARAIKKSHLQGIVDGMARKGMSHSSTHKVKVLAKMLFDYALADDIVDKNYAELIELSAAESKEKESFTDFEIRAIEKLAVDNEWANTILILIYTGMRIGELLGLTKFGVDLDRQLITGGIKTDAGKNRIIPIHPKIQKYIKAWHDKEGSYLISQEGKRIRVDYYRKYLYYPAIGQAEVRKLSPHATRHTFASLLNKSGANTKSIQQIIGHADYATTANIYTHVDVDELKKAIESI